MAKLYFGSTNAGYLTIAVDEASGRACYMFEDGLEGAAYPSNYGLGNMEPAEAQRVCIAWLNELAECNSFDDLHSDCDVSSGYRGICSAADALEDVDVLASVDY